MLVWSLWLGAVPVSLLPKPQRYEETKGVLVWSSSTPLTINRVEELPEAGRYQEEAYTLRVTTKGVSIEAVTELGEFRARQTLAQLKMLKKIPCCEITDWASFSIRGFMQDVGRSYIPLEELKREIDLLSRFKVNVFHWHLTENQAWRLESKLYPQLIAAENMTRHAGKFYTQEEARELVRFCEERRVMLIPELDMPGHSQAFVRAFGCDMQSLEGMAILKNLLKEACEVFKGVPYLHIGTDEVQIKNPDFVPSMVQYVRAQGMKVISWNPGASYKAGEIDMTQLWSYRGAVTEGVPAIDCRLHYINHYDNFADIIALYTSTIGKETQEDKVKGTILCLWNDRLLPDERQIVGQNSLYPSMLAAAERAWLGDGSQYFDQPGTILPAEGKDREEFIDFEARMLWHKEKTFAGEPFPYVQQTQEYWNITEAFPNGGDLGKVFPPERKLCQEYTWEGKTYKVGHATGAGIYLRHVWGSIVGAYYADPQPNHTAYAYTWIHSDKEQQAGLLLEFQNYSRSEKDWPAPQGCWDTKGSRIWLNDTEILPPVWTTTVGDGVTNETLLGNENAASRKPLSVILHKGWNKVLLKLPVGPFNTEKVRLVKWMFCCAFVTPDGSRALDGITYHLAPK